MTLNFYFDYFLQIENGFHEIILVCGTPPPPPPPLKQLPSPMEPTMGTAITHALPLKNQHYLAHFCKQSTTKY